MVSDSILARLDDTWLRTTGRAPTEEDRKGLIDQYVQEEALAREAEMLGMGENDEIIKRRLAQKMRFVSAGTQAGSDPSDGELKQWFQDNRDRFNIAEKRSFHHIYFSPEQHGDTLEREAGSALAELKNGADWKSLGDPFMQKRSYADMPKKEVIRAFGPDFAESIFQLPMTEWSKPIGSAFGLHLVRIEAINREAKADFDANKERIRAVYVETVSDAARQQEIENIVEKYDVVIAR